jgi:enoyl-CoA hydratase
VVEPGDVLAAAMAEAERLKPIAGGAYWRNKILARQPAIDAISATFAG